ncbi:prepilin-type N-terminal cleavage/methylation domain-containing protein [Candidatus Pacearchaeota archaeon]|nr:prepilin-type N-terminal cleavage/methylation domain-containing protein [Candidatus Pacearchaeota archaeon]
MKNQKGFTLLDLMIVSAIMLILSALTIPHIQWKKRQASGVVEQKVIVGDSQLDDNLQAHDINLDYKLVFRDENGNRVWKICVDGYQYLSFLVGSSYAITQQFKNNDDAFQSGIVAITCENEER